MLLSVAQVAIAQLNQLDGFSQERLKAIPTKDHDSIYLALGDYNFNLFSKEGYRNAMAYYLEALKLSKQYNNGNRTLLGYKAVANLYNANKNTTQAAKYYRLYYDGVLKKRPFNATEVLKATYNITNSFTLGNQVDSAYAYTLKMAQILPWIKDKKTEDEAKLLIAYSYLKIGKTGLFTSYFYQLSNDAKFTDGELPFAIMYAETKSEIALLNNDLDNAAEPLIAALAQSRDSHFLLNRIVDIYEIAKNYERAFAYQSLLQSQYNRDKKNTDYIDHKLLEVNGMLLEREKDASDKKLILTQNWFYILAAISIVALLIIVALAYFLSSFSKAKLQYKLPKEQSLEDLKPSEQSEVFKQVAYILQEAKTSMKEQFVNANSITEEQLQDVKLKLAGINLAFQLRAQNLTDNKIYLQQFLDAFLERTLQIFQLEDTQALNFKVNSKQVKIDVFKLCTFSLILGELLRNTAKQITEHSHTEVAIECSITDREIRIDYIETNNSKAYEEAELMTQIGLKHARTLLKNLDAKYMVSSDEATNHINTVIVFPV